MFCIYLYRYFVIYIYIYVYRRLVSVFARECRRRRRNHAAAFLQPPPNPPMLSPCAQPGVSKPIAKPRPPLPFGVVAWMGHLPRVQDLLLPLRGRGPGRWCLPPTASYGLGGKARECPVHRGPHARARISCSRLPLPLLPLAAESLLVLSSSLSSVVPGVSASPRPRRSGFSAPAVPASRECRARICIYIYIYIYRVSRQK